MHRLLLALLLLPALVLAQNTSCSLNGTVQDAQGAVIPNAKVTLTGEGNGFVLRVSTTTEGFFSFPDLTPASFTLSIEASGFKTYKQTGILIARSALSREESRGAHYRLDYPIKNDRKFGKHSVVRDDVVSFE